MAMVAMWLQQTEAISSGTLLTIFVGVIALSMVIQAIVLIAIAVKAASAVKDLNDTAEEFKAKLLPLLSSAIRLGNSAEDLMHYTSPKVKTITDNVLKTSETVRASVQQFDKTMTDVNLRTQRQVSRVDGMVTAALTTTAELAETIQQGIRVPVLKIAQMANQVKFTVEGIVARLKSKAAGSPSGSGGR